MEQVQQFHVSVSTSTSCSSSMQSSTAFSHRFQCRSSSMPGFTLLKLLKVQHRQWRQPRHQGNVSFSGFSIRNNISFLLFPSAVVLVKASMQFLRIVFLYSFHLGQESQLNSAFKNLSTDIEIKTPTCIDIKWIIRAACRAMSWRPKKVRVSELASWSVEIIVEIVAAH